MERNANALANAFKSVVNKNEKIKEHQITPKISKAKQNELVELLARNKGDVEGKEWTEFVSGQRWYVEDLMAFCKLNAKERLDHEYSRAFADVANEDEMLQAIEEQMAS